MPERSRQRAAGYSTRTLPLKLGLKAGDRVAILKPPDGYLSALGESLALVKLLSRRAKDLDLVHWFVRSRKELERTFPKVVSGLKPDGMLWVSWPKQSSPLAGELNETIVREVGLAAGLVDVKVAAIDYDWSGLKFVYRLKDRER